MKQQSTEASQDNETRLMTRRSFSVASASTLVFASGCTAEGLNTNQDNSEESLDDPRDVRISNNDNSKHTVTIEVERSNRTVLDGNYDIESNETKVIDNVAERKSDYDVTAKVSSQEKSYTWKVTESVIDLIVEVDGDGELSINLFKITGKSGDSSNASAGT